MLLLLPAISIIGVVCNEKGVSTGDSTMIRLLTLDPGHFHAALVQKKMYDHVDSVVQVYAPAGQDLQWHLDRISAYNSRGISPTHWKQEVYSGPDFFEKMMAEQKNLLQHGARKVVVLSGNNQKKAEYILELVQNGFHVFADKPMVIDNRGFEKLKEAFEIAGNKNLLLYDIMTERFEITTVLQRELSMLPGIFGQLEKGTPEYPAITKESVHHLYKYVSGNVLTRPAWFMDVNQQGEGMVDVMTHLVDLVQWTCFPNERIDFKKDIGIVSAKRWTTPVSKEEFTAVTGLNNFPEYLQKNMDGDATLRVYCNGEINYRIKDVFAKTAVTWNYKAPGGAGDTHYSIMRGSKANLVIRQGKEENYKPVLYIEPVQKNKSWEDSLVQNFQSVVAKFPGLELTRSKKGWSIKIPEQFSEGHEAHFGRVMDNFLDYLQNKNLPVWEVPNMLAKYYITTHALELAIKNEK